VLVGVGLTIGRMMSQAGLAPGNLDLFVIGFVVSDRALSMIQPRTLERIS
jgi:hypothetical protein